jgi:hypothetical protein
MNKKFWRLVVRFIVVMAWLSILDQACKVFGNLGAVGDAATRANHDKTPVNKGRDTIGGYPRRGDRCGDRFSHYF